MSACDGHRATIPWLTTKTTPSTGTQTECGADSTEWKVTETDLELSDGNTLHVYDTGPEEGDDQLAVFWHHGTPNLGAPPEPLFPTAARLNIRWVSYDRPGYGGSSPAPGRTVASAATYVSTVADALDIDRFAAVGHSGGGPRALACGTLLPERVVGVVSVAGLASFDADGLDWFEGMTPSIAAENRAAAAGRETFEAHIESGEFDPEMFTRADHEALADTWSWLNTVAGLAMDAGPDGFIDDNLACVTPWGFDPAQLDVPTLLLHGDRDRVVPPSHSEWLARNCPSTELRLSSGDGHISVLNSAEMALEWLREQAHQQSGP